MTKQYLNDLAYYNEQANAKMRGWFSEISEEQAHQFIENSFPSIFKTVLHIAAAEYGWALRLSNQEFIWKGNEFNGTKDELNDWWKSATEKLSDVAKNIEETKLNEVITFKRLNGDINTNSYVHCFAHIFNHSTYHRGQLVTMFRQVGYKNVSGTDILTFIKN